MGALIGWLLDAEAETSFGVDAAQHDRCLDALAEMPAHLHRRIDLSLEPDGAPGAWVLWVDDSGPGLGGRDVESLCAPFHSTKPDGMGIGLNLCRSIIESHQGRIRVENLYNGSEISGCRFSFTLPVHVTIPQDTTEPGSHSRQDSNERHSEAEQTS